MATAVAPTDPITGQLRNVRGHVPADLWDQQIGLLMRDYPYDSVRPPASSDRATPTC
ncbi:hypothetical protein [Streptomyces sp. LS1784]|uniref:hypothetical protein n=1 Tax=Streptomyces sp. LS1784 TaxID=2851533 RepID=UPI0027DF48CA|nr:hypothetical protein [Streptomyces sp. LS1784]